MQYLKKVTAVAMITLMSLMGVACTPEQLAVWNALPEHQQSAVLAVYRPVQSGPSEAQWAALRKCESGGVYTKLSASGKYRGAYQFDRRTWGAYGPAGDPAAASPAEQDARAKALYADRGRSPWPVCGRNLR